MSTKRDRHPAIVPSTSNAPEGHGEAALRRAATMNDVVEQSKSLSAAAVTYRGQVDQLEALIDEAGRSLFGWKTAKGGPKATENTAAPEGVVEKLSARLGGTLDGMGDTTERLNQQLVRLRALFEQLGMGLDEPKQLR